MTPALRGARFLPLGLLAVLLPELALARGPVKAMPVTLAGAEELPYRLSALPDIGGGVFRPLDLGGDGDLEILSQRSDPERPSTSSLLLHEIEGRQVFNRWQWNFLPDRGGLAGTGDFNGDRRDEILLWRYEDEQLQFWVESLRGWPTRVDIDTLLVCESLPLPLKRNDRQWLPRSSTFGAIRDAGRRLYAVIHADFSKEPRGLLIFDAAGRILDLTLTANNITWLEFADIDRDGAEEIFLENYASCNGNRVMDEEGELWEEDCRSYWTVLDREGRPLFHREAGGQFSWARTLPLHLGSAQAPRIVGVMRSNQSDDELRIFDGDGELHRILRFESPLQPVVVLDLNRDGVEEILAGFGDGRLICYDADLEVLHHWRLEEEVAPLAAFDLLGDGYPELILRVGDRLAIFDRDMRQLALDHRPMSGGRITPHRDTACWRTSAGRNQIFIANVQPWHSLIYTLKARPLHERQALLVWLVGLFTGLVVGLLAALLWRRWRSEGKPQAEDVLPAESPRTGENWEALYRATQEFGHSESKRSNLERFGLYLKNLHGVSGDRLLPKLQEVVGFFLGWTLPALKQVERVAGDWAWSPVDRNQFRSRCQSAETFALEFQRGADPRPLDLDAVGKDLMDVLDQVKDLRRLAERHLHCQVREAVPQTVQAWLARESENVNLVVEMPGNLSKGRLIIRRNDFEQVIAGILDFHRQRLRGRPNGSIRLSLTGKRMSLQVHSADDSGRPLPGAADLEMSGLKEVSRILEIYGKTLDIMDEELRVILDMRQSGEHPVAIQRPQRAKEKHAGASDRDRN